MTVTRNAITQSLMQSRPDVGAGTSSHMELLKALPSDDPETTAEFLLEGRREALRWATEQIRAEFSESTWLLFWQTAVQGIAVAEVAATSGRSAGAIYMARFRVLERLKQKVHEVSRHWDL
jgi:RNA polymerase sigma-70 factor (ECF subfamily)